VTVSWFGPQNQGTRFVGLCLKTDGWMKMVRGHVSTSGGFLPREGTRARVCQLSHKTGGVVADRACGMIVEPPSRRRKRDGRFDGVRCGAAEVRQNYPHLAVVFL